MAVQLGKVMVWIVIGEKSLQTCQCMTMLGDGKSKIGSCSFVVVLAYAGYVGDSVGLCW